MITRKNNSICVSINGREYTVKIGMQVAEYVGQLLLSDPTILFNPVTRVVKVLLYSITSNPINEGTEDLTYELLMSHIDDMEQSEWDRTEDFISVALGFIIESLNKKMDDLVGPEVPQLQK